MKNNIIKFTAIAAFAVFLTACSKNTTPVDSGENYSSEKRSRPAKGERPQFADLLSKMDADKNGLLSITEVKGPLKNDFSSIDTDNDGFISKSEFEAAPQKQRKRRK